MEFSHPIGHICRRSGLRRRRSRDSSRSVTPLLASCARTILQPTPEPPPYARVARLASGAVADAELLVAQLEWRNGLVRVRSRSADR